MPDADDSPDAKRDNLLPDPAERADAAPATPQPQRPIRLPDTDERLLAECELQTFRAGGPGGQHQNKTDTGVRLVHAPSGIVVTSRKTRSQSLNIQDALEKLRAIVAERNKVQKKRKATRVSKAKKAKRVDNKRQHAQKKARRQKPRRDDS